MGEAQGGRSAVIDMSQYTLFGLVSLDAGSWADWFAGTMSALAVIVALSAYPITKRQKRIEDRVRERELGRSVGWKLLKVLNSTMDIERHIKTGLANRQERKPPGMKFPLVRPLGVPSRMPDDLNQSETDMLLKAQAADLLAEIDMCLGRYASITYAMNEYKNRHEALFELMPPPVARDGMTFTHMLNKEESERIGPYAAMLEALLDSVIALIEVNVAKAKSAMVQYDHHMTRYFGKPPVEFAADPELTDREQKQ